MDMIIKFLVAAVGAGTAAVWDRGRDPYGKDRAFKSGC